MRRALVTVRGGSLASSMMTNSTWRVLPSPILTPPAALMASNLSFCPSATMPIIATTPDIGACVPSLIEVSVTPGDCAAAGPAAMAAASSRIIRFMLSSRQFDVAGRMAVPSLSFVWRAARRARRACVRPVTRPTTPSRATQHHHDHHAAIDQSGQRDVHVGRPFGQEHDEQRADECAADAGDPADDRADQEVERLGHLERLRAHIGVHDREQPAAEARERRAGGERGEPHRREVHAERFRDQPVVAHGAQRSPGVAAREPPRDQDADRHAGEADQVDERVLAAGKPRRRLRLRHADAGRALGDRLELERDRRRQHREAERDEGERQSLPAQRRDADHEPAAVPRSRPRAAGSRDSSCRSGS